MKHASQTDFGRPETVVPLPDTPNKWRILKALIEAAEDFEIGHQSLNVLRALLTFLPEIHIPDDPTQATVFPSNRTLSARLNGMPESTLRRHLARLVTLGIVNRRDSPNRKRFARRAGREVALAYGFDLSPLAHHSTQIVAAAEASVARAQQLRVLRDRVAEMRQALLERAGINAPHELIEATRLLLRRKPNSAALQDALEALRTEIVLHAPAELASGAGLYSANSSADDDLNERHIQESDRTDSDSDSSPALVARNSGTRPDRTDEVEAVKPESANLQRFIRTCKELKTLFPEPVRDWSSLIALSEQVAPMMGIDQPVMAHARHAMGARQAALAVICILERHASIRSPGAYLRRLTQMATAGRFSVTSMVNGVLARAGMPNCQLAT